MGFKNDKSSGHPRMTDHLWGLFTTSNWELQMPDKLKKGITGKETQCIVRNYLQKLWHVEVYHLTTWWLVLAFKEHQMNKYWSHLDDKQGKTATRKKMKQHTHYYALSSSVVWTSKCSKSLLSSCMKRKYSDYHY